MEKEQVKDYSLLRPFDLEAAKRGEKICTMYGNDATFIGVLSNGRIVFESPEEVGEVFKYLEGMLKMKPLAWVEGKPVYRGDTVYTTDGRAVVVNNTYRDRAVTDGEWVVECCAATWQKPKTKREGWVNIYPHGGAAYYKAKSSADALKAPSRIACVRIEWDE